MTRYAIGFLRRDVSGHSLCEDHATIHTFAAERELSVVLVYYGDPDRPGGAVINRLMNLAYNESVDGIIAPSADHFEPGDIPALAKIADVICADTGNRYTVRTDASSRSEHSSPSRCSGAINSSLPET